MTLGRRFVSLGWPVIRAWALTSKTKSGGVRSTQAWATLGGGEGVVRGVDLHDREGGGVVGQALLGRVGAARVEDARGRHRRIGPGRGPDSDRGAARGHQRQGSGSGHRQSALARNLRARVVEIRVVVGRERQSRHLSSMPYPAGRAPLRQRRIGSAVVELAGGTDHPGPNVRRHDPAAQGHNGGAEAGSPAAYGVGQAPASAGQARGGGTFGLLAQLLHPVPGELIKHIPIHAVSSRAPDRPSGRPRPYSYPSTIPGQPDG